MKKQSKKREPLSTTSEWTFELLEIYDKEISRIAENYGLTTYPNQIEVISAEQMLDAYSSVGMPVGYSHWSFGKQFIAQEKNYRRGHMGLAYEIVINSNPCIAYLMEENSMPMQALVIAHACYGHNSFFKNNYLFKTWTNADAIIDYLLFAKNYIRQCEERHGIEEVELLLDSCHALMNYGVDRYKRPQKLSMREEHARQEEREAYLQSQVNDLWRTLPVTENEEQEQQEQCFPSEPQENLLYFFEKHSPVLEPWQREIVRIVRKLAQYFYPQRQTKVMNEGWATFWHYTLLNTMYDEGLVTDGFMIEFLKSHSDVVYQPPYHSPYYNGINPYALGFAMFSDLRRICENPTDEDRKWFPDIAGTEWVKSLHQIMENYKDESFILQYLSPKLIREFKFFSILDDDNKPMIDISSIHDDDGYHKIRQILADQHNIGNLEPNIQVYNVNRRTDRALTLRYYQNHRRPLNKDVEEVLKHVVRLWGFDVKLECQDDEGQVYIYDECRNDAGKVTMSD